MANAKKCDRCGKYYESMTHSIQVKTIIDTVFGEEYFKNDLDLCDDCFNKFSIFMTNVEVDSEKIRRSTWRTFFRLD